MKTLFFVLLIQSPLIFATTYRADLSHQCADGHVDGAIFADGNAVGHPLYKWCEVVEPHETQYTTHEFAQCTVGFVEGVLFSSRHLVKGSPKVKICLALKYLEEQKLDEYRTHENGTCADGYFAASIWTNPGFAQDDPKVKSCVRIH